MANSTPGRIVAGVCGLAITAYLLVSALGGRRAVTAKARKLVDWKKVSSFASEALANSSLMRKERSNGQAHASH